MAEADKRQVAGSVAVFRRIDLPTCKESLTSVWTDGDPPMIKSETLIKIVFGARRRVLGASLRRGFQKDPLAGGVKLFL